MWAFDFGRFGFAAGGCVLGLSAMACGGPTLADLEQGEVLITLAGLASDPETAALGESQGGLGVSRAFLSASAVSLLPCLGDANDIVLGARGYELLLQPPLSERVTTAVSELCGLRVDITPIAEGASAQVPEGVSLYVEGQDATGAELVLKSESSGSLVFEAAAGSSFGGTPLLLGFDLSVWLAGLPLAEDMAAESAALFESQLLDAAALYEDGNGNQLLDDDEQTPVARASAPR